MADGRVVIDVLLDDGTVAKGVADLDKQLGGLQSSGEKASLGIGKIVTALGLVALGAKAIGLVRDSINTAFGRIDTLESFERVMTAITGSTEETILALERTREAVVGTAYGLDIAAKGVQDFVTRGVSVDKATQRLAAWGDAVAFYGNGSNEQLANVMDALAKMTTSGKVGMDQLNRLFDAGIDAVGMYAKATGRDAAQVQKDLSAGKITSEEFIDVVSTAMMEGTNGVLKIAGAAKEAGASWGASFANMRAAVARGVENIIKKIDEMLTQNGLPDMRSIIASFGKTFENVLNSIAENIPIVVNQIKNLYNFLKPIIPILTSITLGVLASILAHSGYNSVTTLIGKVKTAHSALNNVLKNNPWIRLVLIIAAVIGVFIALYNNNEWFREQVDRIWQAISQYISVALKWIQGIVQVVMEYVTAFFAEKLEQIREFWAENGEQILENVQLAWDTIMNVISVVIEGIREMIQHVTKRIKEIWDKHGDTIMTIISKTWELIKLLIRQTIDNIKSTIKFTLNMIKGIFQVIWPIISNVVKVAWEFIKLIVKSGIDYVAGIIDVIMSLIKGDWEGAWNAIKGIGEKIWRNIEDFFSAIDLVQIGKDIIQGLIDGIGSMASAVWKKVTDISDGVKKTIKGALSIFSPSRWMRDEIGVNLMKGFEVGVDKEKRSVLNKADESAQWMKPDVSGFINRLKGIGPPIGSLLPSYGVTGYKGIGTERDSNNFALGELIDSIQELASRPVSLQVNGREFARFTFDDITEFQELKTNRVKGFRGGGL
ncbi:hypothetical protein BC6307_17900 [Sutcliffiella cohnii]|uniref:Tape measure protein N-terminal domain-containing protein n=1 Tax=Sutcliffiella cohnii TaxID=33932 RepID=A0A223KU28_9BACI|nr:tape measure protein [Sutcliffiella cohnii]AST93001.1 hypothetical protein BC6307_17900 [Sutcliffiella cohnii]